MNDIDADAVPTDPDAGPSADAAELERLRRLAFGRTITDADEAAAAEARLTLARWQAQRAADAGRAESTEGGALSPLAALAAGEQTPPLAAEAPGPLAGSAQAQPLAEDEHPTRARRRWRDWVAPAAVGLLVGAVAVGAVSFAMRPASSDAAGGPTPAPTALNNYLGEPPDENTLPPGDFDAAQRWFARKQNEEDLIGVPELRPEFERGSVRLVHSSALARVWLVKQINGRLCLETTDTQTQSTNGTCVLSSDFEKRAITVTSDVLTAVWSGTQLSVVLHQR